MSEDRHRRMIELDPALAARVKEAASKAAESEATIIRVTMRSGLDALERAKFKLLPAGAKARKE